MPKFLMEAEHFLSSRNVFQNTFQQYQTITSKLDSFFYNITIWPILGGSDTVFTACYTLKYKFTTVSAWGQAFIPNKVFKYLSNKYTLLILHVNSDWKTHAPFEFAYSNQNWSIQTQYLSTAVHIKFCRCDMTFISKFPNLTMSTNGFCSPLLFFSKKKKKQKLPL